MILKLLISVSILTLYFGHVAATGCHELQLSQLKSLTERMNQMIDTISSLLPTSLKKLTPPAPASPTPAPVLDYLPTTAGQDMRYYVAPPAYSPPMQHVMYVPSYPALPTDIRQPSPLNPISTPHNYIQAEAASQPGYPFPAIPSYPPQSPGVSYNEQPIQYLMQAPTPPMAHPSYPSGPYSLIQSPYPPEYVNPYPFGYPLPTPSQPNSPANMPSFPLIPIPVPYPPGAYMLPYPQISEIPQ